MTARNPVRDRADRCYRQNTDLQHAKLIPAPEDGARIADTCAEIHPSYGDHVMLCAFLAARRSEIVTLDVGNVDWSVT